MMIMLYNKAWMDINANDRMSYVTKYHGLRRSVYLLIISHYRPAAPSGFTLE